jgi:DNA gyrase/topoisomerase IV subunit B
MIGVLFQSIRRREASDYKGPIQISVIESGREQVISINCVGLSSELFNPVRAAAWTEAWPKRENWQFGSVAVASKDFSLESSHGRKTVSFRLVGGLNESRNVIKRRGAPFLCVAFRPDPRIFGKASHDELYKIAGIARDFSLLCPGLTTSFEASLVNATITYHYEQGLRSLLFEEDYARWPLHSGCLSFAAAHKKFSVEAHLRFLHAGPAHVWSYVNCHPSQGGAHLEGLGAALSELFRDAAGGCREIPFVTNPDSNATVTLPHALIGAIKIEMIDPRYAGPTKDILIGREIREFVHHTAKTQLRNQWDRFTKKRKR